jgi:haloacetate dehalogenase
MFEGFEPRVVELGSTSIFATAGGIGLPLLLLHGFPESHLMWRDIAPVLAQQFAVVCADLRGYGQSGTPPSAPDHGPYTKRTMAQDMIGLMNEFGHRRFMVAGHDRGGRVAYRMALDHPTIVEKLAVLDIVPTADAWDRADARFALSFWPWSLLAQPAPFPEQIVGAAPEAVIRNALSNWGSPSSISRKPFAQVMRQCWATANISMRYVRNTAQRRHSTMTTMPRTARLASRSFARS